VLTDITVCLDLGLIFCVLHLFVNYGQLVHVGVSFHVCFFGVFFFLVVITGAVIIIIIIDMFNVA